MVLCQTHFIVIKYIVFFPDGEVFSWGKSARGRLGRPVDESHLPKSVQLDEQDAFEIVSIACSNWTTLLATKRELDIMYSARVITDFI